jgi:hypothetical protein
MPRARPTSRPGVSSSVCQAGGAWVALLVLNAVLAVPLLGQQVGAEYRLKAAVVAKLPQFVDGPPEAWQQRDTLDLCVARPSPFGPVLETLVVGESLGGRRLAVREVDAGARPAGCHLLFIGGEPAAAARLVRDLVGQPVLTVGDRPGFLDAGGIVELRLVDGRVRFEISAASAERAGLRLSAQLLRLALVVRGRS